MNNRSLMKIFHICIDKEGAKIQASTLYRKGIVLVDEIGSPVNEISRAVGEMLKNQFGVSNALWSNTFHKSLEKVATAPIEQLITEQLIHYCSTYGMEALGYKAIPVIPFEQLNLNFDEQPNVHAFTVIRVVSEATAEAYIKEYLRITLAPNKTLITDIIDLMDSIKITPDEVALLS